MSANPAEVVLVGYQDQGNLGMGYLAAVLRQHGHTVDLVDVRDEPVEIAARLSGRQPLVVGFSLIFQAFLPQFRRAASHLRSAGVRCHFTIGGHFASLCHKELLTNFPELDSVVRYEGEHTLLELVERLKAGENWRDVHDTVYMDGGRVVETEARALVAELDSLPFPHRPNDADRLGGFYTLPLLASRGCARRCSF
jgi:anaerobic magnesium-protoporphyrin IX monomethyl ester cyclase